MSYVQDTEACRGQASCLLSKSSDVISALSRVYELRSTYDIAAVNLSLAGDGFPNYCDSESQAMTDAINLLRAANIATVIASGNDSFSDAISFPACISSAVSVGATGDGSVADTPIDAVAIFSNSAPFLNLLAPGRLITSSVPGGGVAGGSGTSQAAAHVSGAWAMLKQKEPSATVDQVLNKLASFGASITDPRNGVAKPRIQIDAALEVNIPPETWIGEYYNNPNLADAPVLARNDGGGFIDRNLTGASPAPGFVGTENYSIRWTRTLTLTAGTYRFSATGDDGVRVFIDGDKKIDGWGIQAATSFNADVNLSAGVHDIRLEYFQAGGGAQVRLIWGILNPSCSQTVPASRWKGEYFNNANLAGSSVMTLDDGSNDSLSFNWGDGGPSSPCNLPIFADYFSVRWTRTVNFAQGVYRFTAFGDNGVRLWGDDQLKINRWTETVGTNTADVQLSLGDHKIVLEFFETWGGAAVSLSWAPLLPPSNLVASAASVTQVNLSWTDNTIAEDGFKIERWNGSGYAQINTVGANVTTYTDPGLAHSTTYHYRVRAYNSAGDSGYSNESSATTPSCNFIVSPLLVTVSPSGINPCTVNVEAPAGSPWTAVSNVVWIGVYNETSSGVGNGVVRLSIPAYFGNTSRIGTVTIAGKTFTLVQKCNRQVGGCLD
jgi:hypothetical protein